MVKCLLLPNNQADRDHCPPTLQQFFSISSFLIASQSIIALFIISIDLHLFTAEPIYRPSLEFLVIFNDRRNCHLELTQHQSIHVKLPGIHPTHLEGFKISPVSVALNNPVTMAMGACCLSLGKSQPLDPWYCIQGSSMDKKHRSPIGRPRPHLAIW